MSKLPDWKEAPQWANVLLTDEFGAFAWATAYHKHATWAYCSSGLLQNGLDPLKLWTKVEERPSVLNARIDLGIPSTPPPQQSYKPVPPAQTPIPESLAEACRIQPDMEVCAGIDAVLEERGARYGDFTKHARLAQELQEVMKGYGDWEKLSYVQRQALTVIADKIARILNGDPNYADNWVDIQGYAKLVEDRLDKNT